MDLTFNIFVVSTPPRSFDQNSLDRNCVLSVDRNFDNQLTKFLDAFQLIKTFNNDFGQTPKFKVFDRIIRSNAKKEPTDFGS